MKLATLLLLTVIGYSMNVIAEETANSLYFTPTAAPTGWVVPPVRSYNPNPPRGNNYAESRRPYTGVYESRRNRSRVRYPEMSKTCDRFMADDGTLGPDADKIIRAIRDGRFKNNFLADGTLTKYCPAYDDMKTEEERIQAWVAFWTVLGHPESQCGADPTTYSRKMKEYGIWQLERNPYLRVTMRPNCQPECTDISSVQGEINCSTCIMWDTQLRPIPARKATRWHRGTRGRLAGTAYSPGSHWGPIRRSRTQLIPRMARYAFCHKADR